MPINASKFARHLGFAIPEKVFELGTLGHPGEFNGGRFDIGRAGVVGPAPAADAPPHANDDHFTTDEATAITGNVLVDNGTGADSDPDGPPLTVATVMGSAANVGVQVTLASGAHLTINADGSFTYDPNHGFDATPSAASGASNLSAQDFFAYGLAGGDVTGTALGVVTITGLDTDDILYGTTGADTLHAGVGNDRLFSLAGADMLFGGTGDDTYFVDDAGDAIVEADNEGYDVVAASVNYTLSAGAHVELMTTGDVNSTAPLVLTGNEFANEIWGNAAVDVLIGGDGNDALVGFGGNDTLVGGAGADVMIGGAGFDTYVVDNVGDVIVDSDISTVAALIDYFAPGGLNVVTISTGDDQSTNAINLTGNEIDQRILGNDGVNMLSGANGGDRLFGNGGDDVLHGDAGNDQLMGGDGNDILDGGTGADTLTGGIGNDIYFVDLFGETIIEANGQGFDTVVAGTTFTLGTGDSIELLTTGDINGTAAGISLTGNEMANQIWGNGVNNVLDGGAGDDALIGFAGDDTLIGRAGYDLLVGGAGNDTLTGGSEGDNFAFVAALGAGNVDLVTDFVEGIDKFSIDDAVFTGLSLGVLSSSAFVIGTQAHDADDRIIYDPTTGELFFDADGNGAGAQISFAVLQGIPTITAADFTVV